MIKKQMFIWYNNCRWRRQLLNNKFRKGGTNMVIEDFIPKSNEELINKLNNKFFKGEFYLENNMIYWKYADVIILRIILFNQNDESYIEYYVNKWGHDHVPVSELFGFLLELNNMEFAIKYKGTLLKKKYVELIPLKQR